MQIISYLNSDNLNQTKDKKDFLRKKTEIQDINIVNQGFNIDLAFQYTPNFNTKVETKSGLDIAKAILTIISLLLSISIFILVAFFTFSLGLNIEKFNFFESTDSQLALQEYLFPPKEELANENIAVNLEDFLNVVEFKTYKVRVGDTISGIAYKFGLNSIGTIIALNDISNVKKLKVGEQLKIPSTDGLFHTVKSGENIAFIASKYNLSINNILDANDLKSEIITVGQELFIPGASLSNFELKKALGELFIYPVKGRLTSPFGYRRDPFTGIRSFHNGIDIANRKGTPVKCIMDGRVIEVGYSSIYGNYVIITHNGGYQSLYGHLHSVYVKRNKYISQGTKIGALGNTGRSTGPHLHLSIYKNGKVINPLTVLEK